MIEWIQNKVFPDAVHARSFGDNVVKFVGFEPDSLEKVDNYGSDIIFGVVTLETKSGPMIEENVIIKYPSSQKSTAEITFANDHFQNELLFYTEVIPLFHKYDTEKFLSKNVPKFIYGVVTAENPNESVIILKNLHKIGFRMTTEMLFLNEKHIQLAVDKLAKYHALSFRCQREDPEGFNNVISKIRVFFFENPDTITELGSFLNVLGRQSIDPLKNEQKYKDKLGHAYKHCENALCWMKKCLYPSDLMNVLVHGDLTRNNLLYKYDTDGQPVEIIFLDWGSLKYCSPVVDLGLFLMVNTSPEVKQLHWDEFLRTYHGTLSRQLAQYSDIPSFQDVELEMRRKGVYGFHCSSFFALSAHGIIDKEAFELMDPVSKMKYLQARENSKAIEYLTESVKHMLDRDFIFEH